MIELDIVDSKILIVDDELDNILILKEILKRDGFKNITGESEPRKVVELQNEHCYDLILLDLQMPFLSGFEIMELLKAQLSVLPEIIILTGKDERDIRRYALENGAKDFIVKPFDHKEVVLRMRNILTTRLLHQTLTDQTKKLASDCRLRTEELHNIRQQVSQCIGVAAGYRDDETGQNVIRMGKVSACIAKALNWSDEQCELLLHASSMHDIGKIGIPDNILLKPGTLNIDEWEVMQTHTLIGLKILSIPDSELFKTAAEIANTHHEKWDGSGYPYGLIGDEIPMMSRIVALTDTFDALISERPYKKAWPVNEAVAYVHENSGKHFDPKVVKAFEKVLDEILNIILCHSEEGEFEFKSLTVPMQTAIEKQNVSSV